MPLAECGYAVTCVELGEQLSAIGRRKVAGFPSVQVITTNFETWQPEHSEFDAVVAFTAFHWIAPELRYSKTAELLRAGGKLAVVSTAHVLPHNGDPFFVEVQEDYESVVPDDPATKASVGGPKDPGSVGDLSDEIFRGEVEASGRFRYVCSRRYLWDVAYTADEYVAVLSTYSGHRALDDETRHRLLARIHRRIEARPGRSVRKSYLVLLHVAERV